MKFLPLLCSSVLTANLLFASPPETFRADRYKDLYLNSAITDDPPEVTPEDIPTDLPDWVLVGVSKYMGEVKVELMNIKDRSRVRIPSPEATELGFAVNSVEQGRDFVADTVVSIKKGNAVADVRFDPKFLVLKKISGPAPAAAKPAGRTAPTNAPPRPGTVPTPKPSTKAATPQKRTRYVPRPKK